MTLNEVFLHHREKGTVTGNLKYSIDEEDLDFVDRHWEPYRYTKIAELATRGVPREDWPQSAHWNWRNKVQDTQNLLAYHGFSIYYENQLQGLMQLVSASSQYDCRILEQKHHSLVYVEYIETAPWNQVQLNMPIIKGIGIIFIRAAILLSIDEGLKGRIGLHSLPQSNQFYLNCGMTDLGPDFSAQHLHYYEMTETQALRYIEEK